MYKGGGVMDGLSKEVKDIINQQTTFDKIYEQARVVDPISKEVLVYVGDAFEVKESKCCDVWINNCICENCISMRAFNENNVFIKIEFAEDKVFMITAIPAEIKGKKVVVELLKDVTKSMVLGDGNYDNNIEIIKIINQANLAAVTDALTNIYNKRYILERLPMEMVICHVEDRPLSIIMTDLDCFKKINDDYGHMAGDFILKEFAYILERAVRRDKDWVSRFGGEEFLICLTDTERDKALKMAERIRKEIEGRIFKYKGQEISITASFGVYSLRKDEIKDMDTFIHYADKQLYEAKRRGKNRVEG
jgi:diguanylate cyclase (GGDEF)-like protein